MKTLKRFSATLLVLLLVIGMLPNAAFAAEKDLIFKITSNQQDAKAKFIYCVEEDFDPKIGDYENEVGEADELISANDASTYGIYVTLTAWDSKHYKFLGWELNGVSVKEENENYDIFYADNGDGYGYWVSFSATGETLDDLQFNAVFELKTEPECTPTVSIADADADKGTVDIEFLRNTDHHSTWVLTAAPSPGQQLAYIQVGEDTGTRVDSADGRTITWTVSETMDYTAYFKTAQFTLGTLRSAPSLYAAQILDPAKLNKAPISAGQRVGLQFDYVLPSETAEETAVSFAVYAGAEASGAPLAAYEGKYEGLYEAGRHRFTLVVDGMPKIDQVTVTANLGDNTVPVSKTYTIAVSDAEKLPLGFLSSPQSSGASGSYPTTHTITGGPNVYDAAAFVDSDTGELNLFLGVSGGVMTLSGGALTYMDGMAFGYGSSEGDSGAAFAVGGPDKEHLAAFVRDNASWTYGVYTYGTAEKKWIVQRDSVFEYESWEIDKYTYGLVISPDNIWIGDKHWNGTAWYENTTAFNSFWKENSTTAYAGSANGIYKYSNDSWELVSGTSGSQYIISARRNSEGTVTLLTAGTYAMAQRASDGGNAIDTIQAITVSNGGPSIQGITPFNGYQFDGSVSYGLGQDGGYYAFVPGRQYQNVGASGYTGSSIYQYENGSWKYCSVPEFNDSAETSDMNTKSRPDGVRYTLSPCDGLTLFLGQAGAIYTQYGTTTLTFDSMGGSAVPPITKSIGSSVTAPASPTMADSSFGGWYADSECTIPYSFSKYNVMPAASITLYAKWISSTNPGGPDAFAAERAQALGSLDAAYAKFNQSDYTSANWSRLRAAYTAGQAAIRAAQTYDGIYEALNSAIAAMGDIQSNGAYVTVAASMDANTLGLGYIVKPTLVSVSKGTKASKVITDLLRENGLKWEITGTIDSNFYLAQVYPINQANVTIADYIVRSGASPDYSDRSDTRLGEFDYCAQSGWMYSIGDGSRYPTFPGVGAASWYMSDGEAMRWQFTVTGYGADLNANNSRWGSGSLVPSLGDKTALTWAVAELRGQYTDQVLEANTTYTAAIRALTNPEATQPTLNTALSALNKVSFTDAGGTGVAVPENSTALTPKATVKDGVAAAAVSASDMSRAISDAKKNGSGAIVIEPEISGEARKSTVDLPRTSVSSMAADTEADLMVVTPAGSVTIPNGALASIAAQADGSGITIVVESVEAKTLSAEQQKAVSGGAVFDISILSGGKPIGSFGGKSITISLPYTLKSGEKPEGVAVWYLNDAGKLERVSCKYDHATGLATFTTSHLSRYMVGYDAWTNPFTDVKAGDWYFDAVRYAAQKQLFTGTSATTFGPNTDMTRAMLVTALYRLEGKPAVTAANSFTDVMAGQWYTDAVLWANGEKLVEGYGNGRFGTNDSITREQVAAILYRYARMKGYDSSKTTDMAAYTDAGAVSTWAAPAMKWAVASGLITGTTATALSSGATASRAQVATMLMRFLESAAK